MNERPQLVIGIPTYRRPEKLADLLSVLPQRIAEVSDLDVRVVIADNDPAESARPIAAAAPLDVDYVVVRRPGIAAVRNRLIAAAGAARLLAFIDDDERPLQHWLPALIDTWHKYSADAVMGRVISVFETEIDPWLIETGVFRRRERITGLRLQTAAAGNLLLDLDAVRERDLSFSEELGLAGGEDTLFSKKLIAGGGLIVWCNESRAEDFVPADRLTRGWAMKRAFNGGNAAVEVALALEPRRPRQVLIRTVAIAGGSLRTVLGLLSHWWGRLTSDLHADARGLRTSYRGRGMVARSFGHRHQEYARAETATR